MNPDVGVNPAFVDGLDEASRGLWRSAVESFLAAMALSPAHPAPVLAAAVCLLELDRPDEAIVLLETASALVDPGPEWAPRAAWLNTTARLAAGDPQGAEQASASLPPSARGYARAVVFASQGELAAAVAALLEGRRRPRPARPTRARPGSEASGPEKPGPNPRPPAPPRR